MEARVQWNHTFKLLGERTTTKSFISRKEYLFKNKGENNTFKMNTNQQKTLP